MRWIRLSVGMRRRHRWTWPCKCWLFRSEAMLEMLEMAMAVGERDMIPPIDDM